jgi:hypothetical protein
MCTVMHCAVHVVQERVEDLQDHFESILHSSRRRLKAASAAGATGINSVGLLVLCLQTAQGTAGTST